MKAGSAGRSFPLGGGVVRVVVVSACVFACLGAWTSIVGQASEVSPQTREGELPSAEELQSRNGYVEDSDDALRQVPPDLELSDDMHRTDDGELQNSGQQASPGGYLTAGEENQDHTGGDLNGEMPGGPTPQFPATLEPGSSEGEYSTRVPPAFSSPEMTEAGELHQTGYNPAGAGGPPSFQPLHMTMVHGSLKVPGDFTTSTPIRPGTNRLERPGYTTVPHGGQFATPLHFRPVASSYPGPAGYTKGEAASHYQQPVETEGYTEGGGDFVEPPSEDGWRRFLPGRGRLWGRESSPEEQGKAAPTSRKWYHRVWKPAAPKVKISAKAFSASMSGESAGDCGMYPATEKYTIARMNVPDGNWIVGNLAMAKRDVLKVPRRFLKFLKKKVPRCSSDTQILQGLQTAAQGAQGLEDTAVNAGFVATLRAVVRFTTTNIVKRPWLCRKRPAPSGQCDKESDAFKLLLNPLRGFMCSKDLLSICASWGSADDLNEI